MNLPEILSAPLTKVQMYALVNWIGDDQQRFDHLFRLFTSSHYRVVQRAAWPLSYCVIRYPQLIRPHYQAVIRMLNTPAQPSAVRRNIFRLLDQAPPIPKKYHGQLMDICFKSLEAPQETIAAKAFAMGILATFSQLYPEILPELKTAVELVLPHAAPAVKSRALKILKK